MNKKQYNNIIKNTLKRVHTEDSLSAARAVFKNMGVALPNGDIKEVFETVKTNNYMGWKPCTMEEARAAANSGTAAIGISDTPYVMNRADYMRDPTVEPTKSNRTWGQIKSDGSSITYPANSDYGAFVVYSAI